MKILVLGGGNSSEREVSVRSAAAVAKALKELGHEVFRLDPAGDQTELKQVIASCDVVFPILHGTGGEDGTIQRLIETIGKPYLGSDSHASHLCFDKTITKQLLTEHGLPTPPSQVVDAASLASSFVTQHPFVLKPIADGSSVDTFIVRALPGPTQAMTESLNRRGHMLAETLVTGVEITVPILGNTPLPVIEIIPPVGQEFDFTNKYNGATRELCPPQNVSAELQRQAQELALQAHTICGCRHLSRTDMIIAPGGHIEILEINTMPGLTDQSLFPKAAAAAGISWNQLVTRFVELATSS